MNPKFESWLLVILRWMTIKLPSPGGGGCRSQWKLGHVPSLIFLLGAHWISHYALHEMGFYTSKSSLSVLGGIFWVFFFWSSHMARDISLFPDQGLNLSAPHRLPTVEAWCPSSWTAREVISEEVNNLSCRAGHSATCRCWQRLSGQAQGSSCTPRHVGCSALLFTGGNTRAKAPPRQCGYALARQGGGCIGSWQWKKTAFQFFEKF